MQRYRGSPMWPPWTNSNSSQLPNEILSQKFGDDLIYISEKFGEITKLILDEIIRDKKVYDGYTYLERERRKDEGHRAYSAFTNADVVQLRSATESFTLASTDTEDVLRGLTDSSYLTIWQSAVMNLLEYQGTSYDFHKAPWSMSKYHARGVLTRRSDILEKFEKIKGELRSGGLKDVHDGIQEKLDTLEIYIPVFDRQPFHDGKAPFHEPTFAEIVEQRVRKAQVATAYPDLKQKAASTLTAIISAVTILSFIPMIQAGRLASNTTGSTSDVDFWLLIQNSIMQILGIFTAMFPMYGRSTAHAWIWAQIFTAVGSCCAIAAVPLYIYVPTIWSALVSSIGSASQGFIALQLALLADSVVVPVKRE